MVTLTWRPEEHYLALAKARSTLAQKSEDLETYTDAQIFAAVTRVMQESVQLYLKRVRKSARCQVRFMCVWEAHKSGLPHAHLLVHERGSVGVSERLLRTQWKLGFAHAKVADDRSRWYVTKYLTKSLKARVVASLGYGGDPVESLTVASESTHGLTPSALDSKGNMSDRSVWSPQTTRSSP